LQKLFQENKSLLKCLLTAPAPVHCEKDIEGIDIVGTNIAWNVDEDVKSACDTRTGQEIEVDKVMFPNFVKICCPDGEGRPNYSVRVRGTTEKVLKSIYWVYKNFEKNLGARVVFEGLLKEKVGEYCVQLGS
jgi:hypothetical protein